MKCFNVDFMKRIPCFLNAAFFVNAITNLHYTDSQLHMCISNLTHVYYYNQLCGKIQYIKCCCLTRLEIYDNVFMRETDDAIFITL